MKKIIFMTFIVVLVFVSCGVNKKTELNDMYDIGSEEVEKGDKDIVDKYFELCKVETITEDKVILYSEDEKCNYEIDSNEADNLIEGEYYDVVFTKKIEIDENKYTIEGASFYRQDFSEQVIYRN